MATPTSSLLHFAAQLANQIHKFNRARAKIVVCNIATKWRLAVVLAGESAVVLVYKLAIQL